MNLLINLTNSKFQKYYNMVNLCVVVVSYNRPKLCPNASWNASAITFANSSSIGQDPHGIFVNTKNIVYIAAKSMNLVEVWNATNNLFIRSIAGNFIGPHAVFVTLNSDVYIDNGNNHQIYRWSSNGSSNISDMKINSSCYGIFVDITHALYCSMKDRHMVVKISLNESYSNSTIVAGTGTMGSSADTLRYPQGIFVEMNLDLYVADCENNRIQLFRCGQRNATTVAGNGAGGILNLSCPTGVMLDADNYLYIVDIKNHRIIRSKYNQSWCIVGCSATNGTAPNQLQYPQSLTFDSQANLFVVDKDNYRIQKFFFQPSSCRKYNHLLKNDYT